MNLGKSLEDYIETILILHKEKGSVRSVEVAEHMGFSKASVSHAVKELRKKGYLIMDTDGSLQLTEKGTALAEKVYARHRFLADFFVKLGVAPEIAEEDACQMEHIISQQTYEKLRSLYSNKLVDLLEKDVL